MNNVSFWDFGSYVVIIPIKLKSMNLSQLALSPKNI